MEEDLEYIPAPRITPDPVFGFDHAPETRLRYGPSAFFEALC